MPTGHCGLWDGVGRSKPSKSMLAPRFAFLETLTVRVRALTCRGGTCLDTRGCGQLRRMLEQENWQSVAKHRQPYATAVNWNAVTFKSATKIDLTSLTYICSPVENKQAHIELSQERFAHSNPRSKSGIQTSARAQRTRRSFTVSGACALIYRRMPNACLKQHYQQPGLVLPIHPIHHSFLLILQIRPAPSIPSLSKAHTLSAATCDSTIPFTAPQLTPRPTQESHTSPSASPHPQLTAPYPQASLPAAPAPS